MEKYWIDESGAIRLLYELICKKVVDVEVRKYPDEMIVEIAFENGIKLYIDLLEYLEVKEFYVIKDSEEQ